MTTRRVLRPVPPGLRPRGGGGAALPRRRPGLQRRADASRCCSRPQRAGAALVAFPELGLSAYTCDDLFHQRALLDGCEAALARCVAASRRRCAAVAVVGLPLRVDHSLFNCAAVVHRGRLLGVVPKTYLPNYGEFYEARQFNPADHAQVARDHALLAPDRALRRRPAVRGARTCRCFSFHVEICEDLWVPIPPSSYAALAGATVLRQPVGVEHHGRQVGLPARAGRVAVGALPGGLPVFVGGPGRIDHRPGLGRPGADLRERRAAGRIGALRRRLAPDHRRRRPGAAGARAHAPDQLRPVGGAPCRRGWRAFAACAFDAGACRRRLPLRRERRALPLRAGRSARSATSAATRSTTSRCRAWRSGSAASGIDKLVIGVSGGLDSTHALLVCARAMDLLGPAAQPHPRRDDAGLRHQHAHARPGAAADARDRLRARGRSTSGRAASRCSKDLGHPYAEGKAAVRHHLRERAGRRAHQPPVPARQLQRAHRRRHRRPERAGAGLEHLRRGRPHVALQRQRQRAEDADQAPGALGGRKRRRAAAPSAQVLLDILDTEISPELVPGDAAGQPGAEHREPDRPLRPAGLLPLLHPALRLRAVARWPSWPMPPGTTPRRAPGPKARTCSARPTTWRRSSATCAPSCWRFFKTSQFKRSCVPNAPKVGSGGSLSPRGDWRAPSDARGRRSGWPIWSAFPRLERAPTSAGSQAQAPQQRRPARGASSSASSASSTTTSSQFVVLQRLGVARLLFQHRQVGIRGIVAVRRALAHALAQAVARGPRKSRITKAHAQAGRPARAPAAAARAPGRWRRGSRCSPLAAPARASSRNRACVAWVALARIQLRLQRRVAARQRVQAEQPLALDIGAQADRAAQLRAGSAWQRLAAARQAVRQHQHRRRRPAAVAAPRAR